MTRSPVTVGIADRQHRHLLGFAVAEAVRLDRPLRIVHVAESASEVSELPVDDGADLLDVPASVQVERVTLAGDAATVLLAESESAFCMILGADDPALTPAHWSEVAQQVALHATVPVTVVPLTPVPEAPAEQVLLALDEAHATEGQIAYAIDAAERRGVDLGVVFGAGASSDYPERVAHTRRLEVLLDRWRALHPALSIRVTVEGGHPVASCLEASTHASLLVVGRPERKHPRVGSRSVASRIIRHATVPVVVVPYEDSPAAASALTPR